MVSKSWVEDVLQEEIKKAEKLGIVLDSISPHVEFPKARSFYGMLHREKNNYNGKTYATRIRISYYYLNGPEDEIRETIMHEVLHAEHGSHGHGAQWKSAAAKVNEAYGYHIQRVGTSTEFSIRAEAERQAIAKDPTFDVHKYCVMCPSCHAKWYYPTMRKVVRQPNTYRCCNCKEHLVRIK